MVFLIKKKKIILYYSLSVDILLLDTYISKYFRYTIYFYPVNIMVYRNHWYHGIIQKYLIVIYIKVANDP